MEKEFNSNIFRLAATIYANDDNYNVKTDTIIEKMIEVIFLNTNNKLITIYDIIRYCKEEYALNFSEGEVFNIISRSKNKFNIERTEGNVTCVNLLDRRLSLLKEREQKNNIKLFIDKFVEHKKYENKEEVVNIIYKYLYDIYAKNLYGFKFFNIDESVYNYELGNNYEEDYTEEERIIINEFLNFDDSSKNKAIFHIVSFALEYCLISGNKNTDLCDSGLKNKVFYLDTNIIYRALGINGSRRKDLTVIFLKKCIKAGQIFRITKYTDDEFKGSIEYHINQLKNTPHKQVNPEMFDCYTQEYDMYHYYYEWMKARQYRYPSYDMFKAYIYKLYKEFLNEFSVSQEFNISYRINDPKISDRIKNLTSSIEESKGKTRTEHYDAKNIYFIDNKRKKKGSVNNRLLETRYFLISTDQKLKEWTHCYFDNQAPIILLPTQWLTIILRYYERTDDDYKSFVSFINLPTVHSSIESSKVHAIISGISQYVEDFNKQKELADQILEIKANDIINSENNKSLYDMASDFSKQWLEQELEEAKTEAEEAKTEAEEAKAEVEEAKAEVAAVQQENTKNIQNYLAVEGEKTDLQKQLSEATQELNDYRDREQKKYIKKRVRKWRFLHFIWRIPVIAMIVTLFALQFTYGDLSVKSYKINVMYKLKEYIDSQNSDLLKSTLCTIDYAIFPGSILWLVKTFIDKFTKKHVDKYIDKIKIPDKLK